MKACGFSRKPRRAGSFEVAFNTTASITFPSVSSMDPFEVVELRVWDWVNPADPEEGERKRRTLILTMTPAEAEALEEQLGARRKYLREQKNKRIRGAHEADQANADLERRRQEAGGELKSERVARLGSTIGQLEDKHAGRCPGHPDTSGVIDYIRTVSGFDIFRCDTCAKAFHIPVPKGCVGYKAGASELAEEVGA